MDSLKKIKIVFVCLGNICRSPTAHALMESKCNHADIKHLVTISSAGLHSYHQGDPPDHRSMKTAQKNGLDISKIRSHCITKDDINTADFLIAMDREVYLRLVQLAGEKNEHKIHLFLKHTHEKPTDVPDPYYGGLGEFEKVFTLIDQGTDAWVQYFLQSESKQ